MRNTEVQGAMKGEALEVASSEPMREELVQSAVSFLKHPKVVASSDAQRRSFLENKGLTVDEINEAFGRLLSASSDSRSSMVCTSQGNVSDNSCGITKQEATIGTACLDGSGTPDPQTETVSPDPQTETVSPDPQTETVSPDPQTETVAPRHPKSYIEIMELIQRGERPDDIQDINDEPPNPDQPISEPRMAPKPKPWEKQGEDSSSLDLKPLSSDSGESRSEVQIGSTNQQAMGSNSNSSDEGDLLLTAETATNSEAPSDEASSPKQ